MKDEVVLTYTMLKKISLKVISIVLLLMILVFLFAKDIQISISETEAQSVINSFLKANQTETVGVKVTPKYISIDFKDGNSAQVRSEVILHGHGYNGVFDGKFSTGLDYRIPRLYLNDLQLIDGGFQTDNETQSELSELKSATISVLKRKRKSLEAQNQEDIPNQTNEEIVDRFVVSATKKLFETIPIYDLRRADKVGMVASLALKDVRFTEDIAIVTLSPVTALLRILAFIGFALLFVLWTLGPTILTLILSRTRKANA